MAARLKWGCSSVGRAPALQAGGHEFESHHLHSVPLGIVILYLENCILINLIITEMLFVRHPRKTVNNRKLSR